MSNFFEKSVMGDGTEEVLPLSRRQSFFFYGKQQFWKILLMGIFTTVFFIPCLIWLYAMNYVKAQAISALDQTSTTYLNDYSAVLLSSALKTYLVLIPLVCVFFIGLSGLFHLIKNVCFYDDSSYSQYFIGIKNNWLNFTLWGIIAGLSLFILRFNVTYFTISGLDSVIKGLFIGFAILQFVLVAMATMYFVTGCVTYKYTFLQGVKNAFLLAFNGLFKNFIVTAAGLLPFLLVLFIPSPFQTIALSLLGLFYLGFLSLLWNCYCQSVYDKVINPQLGEQYVGIGLRKDKT